MKKIFILYFLCQSIPFSLAAEKQVTDKAEIQKILRSIPYIGVERLGTDMPYKTIAERLPNLGITVNYVNIAKLEKDDYIYSGGAYKKGDVSYYFSTNEPNNLVRAICPIQSSFSFIKRGNTWIADDRTSTFLSTYLCATPNRSK